MAVTTRLGITLDEEGEAHPDIRINSAWNAIDAAIGALALANAFTNTNTFVGPVGIGQATPTARLHISRTAAAANPSNPSYLKVVGVADTAMAASTEVNDILFDLSRTLQFATGALATQRAIRVQAPTYAAVGASVITTATTWEVSGAPTAGANVTITNAYALRVAAGTARFEGNVESAGQVSLAQLAGAGVPLRFNSLVYTFPTDADQTLNATQLSSPYIDIQAGVITVQRSLIVPLAIGYIFVVRNRQATLGVQIIGSSGTGTVVAAGKIAWLLCSGSNIIRLSADQTP